MCKHYNDPNQYLTCRMCKINKHISYYRFKCLKCRLCISLHRYRFGHTEERYREHVKKYNIHEAVQRSCFANSPIVKHGRSRIPDERSAICKAVPSDGGLIRSEFHSEV